MDESASFLVEKLRARGGTFKSFKEYSKSLRMTLLEKRYALEITEKNYLQECLDFLQQNIQVTTLPAIIERLEVISRHLGLKFTAGPSRLEWFISSDMFYVEVVLEPNGRMKDVKIHHDGTADQQSCEEMKGTLENRDFKDFTLQLEGLISIYNLNADKIIKSQAFTSLQFLEADIAQLYELQSAYMTDPFEIIHKSDVGFVQKRRGGHPMKIIYFISPYDLLDVTTNTYKPLTMDVPDVDYSVSLCLESSSTNKLQTKSLVRVIKSEKMDENLDVHSPTALFDELNSSNSNLLPACFVMKLKERMPVCESILDQITDITDIEVNKREGPSPILGLIKREIFFKHSDCEDDGNIVTLPDQRHCYVMTDNEEMQAYVVQSIPFVHPSQVSRILRLLRQQALFNNFIASCIRPRTIKETNDKSRPVPENFNNLNHDHTNGFDLKLFGSEDFRNLGIFNESPQVPAAPDVIMFEVAPLSLEQIVVSFEHPVEEMLLTADLDLSDILNLRCNISSASEEATTSVTSAQECAARALQRSFSIPATMRALMRLWESLSDMSDEEDANESSANNDVSDLHENAENHLAGEVAKESAECAALEFPNGVTIKLEKTDACESALEGFALANRAAASAAAAAVSADFNAEEIFSLPNPAHGFQPAYDADMPPALGGGGVGGAATQQNFDVPPIFLDNVSSNESSSANSFAAAAAAAVAANVKTESASAAATTTVEFVESAQAFFRNKSASDLFAGKAAGAILIDSSSDSEPADANKETLVDAKEPSPGSTSSEFSALTEMSGELSSAHDKQPLVDFEMDPGMMEMNNLEDVQQFLKLTENKMPKNGDGNTLPVVAAAAPTPATTTTTAASSVLPEHVLPNFSITAVTLPPSCTSTAPQGSVSSAYNSIIPTPSLPPSTTITRVTMKEAAGEDAAKERSKKLKSAPADDKVRIEKTKKKRKRDDSPMGPPEKFRVKSDQISKPTSGGGGGGGGALKTMETPRSPSPSSAFRKYTMSPTPNMSTLAKVVSPNSGGGGLNNNSIKKPGMVTSPGLSGSPKMGGSGGMSSVSPKQGVTSSPKSLSSGGSGKPSMSALKSAVTSPSSGSKSNNELKKSYKESSSGRENKEKKSSNGGGGGSSSGHQSPKPKSSQAKFKQTEMSAASMMLSPQYEGASAVNMDPKVVLAQTKGGKKGMCLASVIDKLNKQQEDKCNNGNGGGGGSGSGSGGKSCSPTLKDMKGSVGGGGGQSTDAKSASQAAKVSNEYMIKQHSSDGIKMTISNKARKEQNLNKLGIVRNSTASGSGSPKHGNLKPNPGSVIICKKSSSKPSSSSSSSNVSGGNNLTGASKHSSSSSTKIISSSSGGGGGSSSNSGSSNSGSGGGGTGGSGGGSSSSSSSSFKSSKSNHSPKTQHSLDPNRSKEKIRPSSSSSLSSSSSSSSSKTHSSSDKSIFSSTPKRSSPLLLEGGEGGDKPYTKQPPLYQPPVVFSKPLDMNFQIPKISDRNKMAGESGGDGSGGTKKSANDSIGSSGGGGGSGGADGDAAKSDTISPSKGPAAFLASDEGKMTVEAVSKSAPPPSLYEAKGKSSTSSVVGSGGGGSSSVSSSTSSSTSSSSTSLGGGETSLDAITNNPMSANCSIPTTVQSSDSIKVNL